MRKIVIAFALVALLISVLVGSAFSCGQKCNCYKDASGKENCTCNAGPGK